MCSLLTLKVLIGIILLGRAHELIERTIQEQQTLRSAAGVQADMKPVHSKDDLDLLTTTTTSSVDPTLLRRTQSLTQFNITTDHDNNDSPGMVSLRVIS